MSKPKVIVTIAPTGGMASAPVAPAAKAIAQRRQPSASITKCARRFMSTGLLCEGFTRETGTQSTFHKRLHWVEPCPGT